MKTKQKAIKIHCNANGWWGYSDFEKAIEDGWRIVRMDYLYDVKGNVHAQVYILETKDES